MGKEKLQAFAEAVSRSEELQKQYTSIQAEIVRSTAEKLAKLSESAGTPFTAEEYLQAVADSSEELSTEQLQTVAGGTSGQAAQIRYRSQVIPYACGIGEIISIAQGPSACPIKPEIFPDSD
jgi:predicted ribosomally synthesized peptide with nif11-like leader